MNEQSLVGQISVIVVVALGTEIVVSAKAAVRVKEAVQEIEEQSILLMYPFAKMFVLFLKPRRRR